jgi:hypothetical protein
MSNFLKKQKVSHLSYFLLFQGILISMTSKMVALQSPLSKGYRLNVLYSPFSVSTPICKKLHMQKISWIPTLVLYCVSSVLCLIINLVELSSGSKASGALVLLSLPVFVVATVFQCVLHHSCWKALPARHRSTTPRKAVSFLFIPFYNFYWVFISFPGLTKGYLKFKEETGIVEIEDTTGLGITYAILFVLSLTLGLFAGAGFGSILTIADLAIFILFYKAISTYANIAIGHEKRR